VIFKRAQIHRIRFSSAEDSLRRTPDISLLAVLRISKYILLTKGRIMFPVTMFPPLEAFIHAFSTVKVFDGLPK